MGNAAYARELKVVSFYQDFQNEESSSAGGANAIAGNGGQLYAISGKGPMMRNRGPQRGRTLISSASSANKKKEKGASRRKKSRRFHSR